MARDLIYLPSEDSSEQWEDMMDDSALVGLPTILSCASTIDRNVAIWVFSLIAILTSQYGISQLFLVKTRATCARLVSISL